MKRKHMKDIMGLTTASIGIGVASGVVAEVGGNTATIGKVSKALPIAGSMIGTGIVMDELNKLNRKVKRR